MGRRGPLVDCGEIFRRSAFKVFAGALAAGDSKPSVGVAEFTNQSGAAWWRGGVGWRRGQMPAKRPRASAIPQLT